MADVNMTPAAGASNYPDLEKPVAFYEKIRPGLAEFMRAGMEYYIQHHRLD